jgi:hypothetical protein
MKARFNKTLAAAKKKKNNMSMGAPVMSSGGGAFPRAETVEEQRRRQAMSGLSKAGRGSSGGGQFPRSYQLEEQRRQQAIDRMAAGRKSGGGSFPRADDVEEQRRQRTLHKLAGVGNQRAGGVGGANFPRADDVRREQALQQLAGVGKGGGKDKKAEKPKTGFHSLEDMMALHEASGGSGSGDDFSSLGEQGKDLFSRAVSADEPDFGSDDEGGDLLDWDDLNTPKGPGPNGVGFSEISLDDDFDLLGGF